LKKKSTTLILYKKKYIFKVISTHYKQTLILMFKLILKMIKNIY